MCLILNRYFWLSVLTFYIKCELQLPCQNDHDHGFSKSKLWARIVCLNRRRLFPRGNGNTCVWQVQKALICMNKKSAKESTPQSLSLCLLTGWHRDKLNTKLQQSTAAASSRTEARCQESLPRKKHRGMMGTSQVLDLLWGSVEPVHGIWLLFLSVRR